VGQTAHTFSTQRQRVLALSLPTASPAKSRRLINHTQSRC
jgi:hypothetical protein